MNENGAIALVLFGLVGVILVVVWLWGTITAPEDLD